MSYIKPDLNERFAENATAPDDIDKPQSSTMLLGWIFGEKPPHNWFNWLLNRTDNALSNLNERGVLDWDAVTTYNIGSMVWANGKVYQSRTNSNLNNAVTLTASWQEQSLPDMPTSGDGYVLYYSGSKLFWRSPFDLDYGDYEGRVASTKKSYIMLNNNVIGNDPLPAEINVGELAVNFKDRTLFSKTPEGIIVPLSGQASIVDFEFVATAGQTTFSPAGGYTTNQIEVFINGRKQTKSAFTANNGVDVVFATGLTAGDEVTISVWASFGLSDAYTQAQSDALSKTTTPVGGIIMYDGLIADIPANWALCDGTNGTPDLVDRFIYGTVTELEIGDTGGSADAVVVEHNHVASSNTTGEHTHTYSRHTVNGGGSGPTKNQTWGNVNTSASGDHSHTITVNNTGVSGVGANLPPYVKLAYIKRVS